MKGHCNKAYQGVISIHQRVQCKLFLKLLQYWIVNSHRLKNKNEIKINLKDQWQERILFYVNFQKVLTKRHFNINLSCNWKYNDKMNEQTFET